VNTIYINLKSKSNYAAETLILSENGKGVSIGDAPAFAAQWGKKNASPSVSYTVTNEAGDILASETISIEIKPLADTLRLDSRHQFFGVLEALQQYVDNCEDAEYLIEESKHEEFRAKLDAVAALRDQLDDVLASLADDPKFIIEPKPEVGVPQPKAVELHIGTSPEFSKYSKKVKALGGKYSDCRGNTYKRFVTLPWTPEGRELADTLVAKFGRGGDTTLIVRGVDRFRNKHVHACVIVHHVVPSEGNACERLLAKYEAAFEKAFPDCLASV
jgi:hypothetical protein